LANKNIILSIILVFSSLISVLAKNYELVNPYSVLDISATAKKKKRFYDGHNIKLAPAFFWNTVGIDGEYVIKHKFSISALVYLKYGRTDGQKRPFIIKNEDYLGQGYRVELQGKYYLKQDKKNKGPYGMYVQGNFSYGNMVYFDGTTRPYTINNRWRDFVGLSVPSEIENPKKISFGAGLGYQVIIIPKQFIANVMVGTQLGFGQKNPFVSFYFQPSLGYILK
jgi:hypothetical protein